MAFQFLANAWRLMTKGPTWHNSPHEADWYRSEEGRQIFENAQNNGERMLFVYRYLCALDCEPEDANKLAYLMTAIQLPSNRPWAEASKLLDPNWNPLVKVVCSKQEMTATNLIRALRGETAKDEKFDCYDALVPYSEQNADFFLLEREIYRLFELDGREPVELNAAELAQELEKTFIGQFRRGVTGGAENG